MSRDLDCPPTRPEAEAGFVIMDQVEYPGMSGTKTIRVATVLLETGMVPIRPADLSILFIYFTFKSVSAPSLLPLPAWEA